MNLIKQPDVLDNLISNISDLFRSIIREELKNFVPNLVTVHEEEDTFYSIGDAAKILGIDVRGMYELNTKKKISYHKPGRICFYKKADIKKYIENNRIKSCDDIQAEVKLHKLEGRKPPRNS